MQITGAAFLWSVTLSSHGGMTAITRANMGTTDLESIDAFKMVVGSLVEELRAEQADPNVLAKFSTLASGVTPETFETAHVRNNLLNRMAFLVKWKIPKEVYERAAIKVEENLGANLRFASSSVATEHVKSALAVKLPLVFYQSTDILKITDDPEDIRNASLEKQLSRLRRWGVRYIGELVQKTVEEIKDFGNNMVSSGSINNALKRHGLTLGMKLEGFNRADAEKFHAQQGSKK